MLPSSELQGGRYHVKFGVMAALLLFMGFISGVNAVTGHRAIAALIAGIATVNVVALVRVYQTDIRLLRVQERLSRQPWPDAWLHLPMKPPPPPAPPPKKP